MTPTIRPIEPSDNPRVAHVIRAVLAEFDVRGEGFSAVDAEIDSMYEAYSAPRSAYLVATYGALVVGGCGIAPLVGGSVDVCELRKFFLLPEGRRKGLGAQLLDRNLAIARAMGYGVCYLETLRVMTDAARLYTGRGFVALKGPMGHTGHYGCDSWYARSLV